MNNEIKEILDKLKKKEEIYLFQIKNGTSFNSDEYEAHLLLDYITNLQEENERLNTQLQQKENIIKEVREYIEEHKQKGYRTPMSDDYEFWNELNENEIKELLEILDKVEGNK